MSASEKVQVEKNESVAGHGEDSTMGEAEVVQSHMTRSVLWKMDVRYVPSMIWSDSDI